MNEVLLITVLVLLAGLGVAYYLMYHRYQKLLKRELTLAQKSEQLKTVFIDNISRTLRSPLNAILGYSNLILENQSATASSSCPSFRVSTPPLLSLRST